VAPPRLAAPIAVCISSFVPDRWHGNIPLESMQNGKLRRNTAAPIAADFYIMTDKLRSYCAAQ
jgi:hypothetical protein